VCVGRRWGIKKEEVVRPKGLVFRLNLV
jgi:hypothetical protein